jgi:hypothetical protein
LTLNLKSHIFSLGVFSRKEAKDEAVLNIPAFSRHTKLRYIASKTGKYLDIPAKAVRSSGYPAHPIR